MFYLSNVVENRVEKDVERTTARSDERPPPPVIVFGAQLEIGHHYRDLGAWDDDDEKDEEEEAKQIVVLILPYRL